MPIAPQGIPFNILILIIGAPAAGDLDAFTGGAVGTGDAGAQGREPGGEDGEFFEERGQGGERGDEDGEGEFEGHCFVRERGSG